MIRRFDASTNPNDPEGRKLVDKFAFLDQDKLPRHGILMSCYFWRLALFVARRKCDLSLS